MIRDSLRSGLYIGIVAGLLALSGIFASFTNRYVVADRLTLSTVTLVLMLVGAGYFAASRQPKSNLPAVWAAGALGALVVGLVLSALVLVEASIDLTFVFPNLITPMRVALTFGQELVPGLLTLLFLSLFAGWLAALLLQVPARLRNTLLVTLGLTTVIGLLESQVHDIIALPDALAVALAFAFGYAGARMLRPSQPLFRLVIGALLGIALGIAFALLVGGSGLSEGGLLRGVRAVPPILSLTPAPILLPLVFGIIGAVGGLVTITARSLHNGAVQFVIGLVVLGVLNWQHAMNDTATLLTIALLFGAMWLLPPIGTASEMEFNNLNRPEQRSVRRLIGLAGLLVMLVAPSFLGIYITDVLNLVGIYIILGIGLNIVVGYAGLLNLGYVAFFAIGAYTVGLLTTPSLLTCGGIPPSQITRDTVSSVCNIWTFWQALPLSVLFAALGAVLLGMPVLRLRGDYFAIVTLGFGEIIRLLVRFDDFKDLFGSAQGIANIPRPTLDLTALNPAWRFDLVGSAGMYYLILAGILLVIAIAARLASSRIGRSWMAMKADEDVAQAMGINLVQIKLLAFAISGAFAGMAGAMAGTRLFGAYPDSFTLLVSINVLSLIIIGGLGSIPGIVVGAFVLVGLPEALRELSDYRLLVFGALLVVAMQLKPEGLIPPPIRRLSEVALERAGVKAKRGELS
jgi:branched-chain amino acid transport system permease protein